MKCNKVILFPILFLLVNCLPKRDKDIHEPRDNLSPDEKSLVEDHQVYALNNVREPVDANELLIYRATLARTELGEVLVPKLNFGVDIRSDYVEWQACPYALEISCLQGTTMQSELYLSIVEPDQYTVTLKACVNPKRSIKPEKNCGPTYTLNWQQDKTYSPKIESQIGELLSKEHDIYALGEKLHEILKQFRAELKFCLKTAGRISIDAEKLVSIINEEIEKQLENLLNMGPKFIAEHMSLVDPQAEDEELAAIAEATLVVDGDSYSPKGLSLSQESISHKIDTYFDKIDTRLLKNYQIFPNISVTELIKANSGIFLFANRKQAENGTKKFTRKEFAMLSSRERSAAIGGALLQSDKLNLTTNYQRESYGSAQIIKAMMWLKKPSSYECQAFDRVEKTLEKTREQLKLLRKRIMELKAILLNSKSQ
ncbi:MAG: hypothetical protein AB8G05_14560 [Oligoflexales bacterium]